MKILIADDEKMARLSLQSMLEELYPDKHNYEFAVDGIDMLNKLDSFVPSVVFLDIKMPKMNGLEALEQCRKDYPNITFIVVSGYSDFEFAQKAISLGVSAYILKPVDIDALKQAFEKATEQMKAQDSLRQNAFEGAVYGYLADETDYEDNAALFGNTTNPYTIFYICRDGAADTSVTRELLRNVTRFCAQSADFGDLYSCHYLPSGKLCLVLSTSRKITYRRFFTELCQSDRFGIVTVFWDEDLSMKSIKSKAELLETYTPLRCLGYSQTLTSCESVPASLKEDGVLDFAQDIEEFVTAFSYSPLEAEGTIGRMRNNADLAAAFSNIPKDALSAYMTKVTGLNTDVTSYDSFLQSMSGQISDTCKTDFDDSNDIIKRAKKYIGENYKSGISINDVADALSLSPAYLSRLFHSKTGEKYIDYVTQLRIEAARQIFAANPGISIKKVAEEVGYYSVRHFKEMYTRYTENN